MRKEGWYWILCPLGDGWEVANWDGSNWWRAGGESAFDEQKIVEIGEEVVRNA